MTTDDPLDDIRLEDIRDSLETLIGMFRDTPSQVRNAVRALEDIHDLLDERLPSIPGGRPGDLSASEAEPAPEGGGDPDEALAVPRPEPVDVTEEPPVGSQVTDSRGQVHERITSGWREWYPSDAIWGSAWSWEVARDFAPLRLTTDADRKCVGMPTENTPEGTAPGDTAPDVDVTDRPHKVHNHGIDPTCREHVGSDGLVRGECVAPDVDPDEALARALYEEDTRFGSNPIPWEGAPYKDAWIDLARTAREHIADWRVAKVEPALAANRDLIARAERAEVERDEWKTKFEQTDNLLSRTRDERDEARQDVKNARRETEVVKKIELRTHERYTALREDVEGHIGPSGLHVDHPDIGCIDSILTRDDERVPALIAEVDRLRGIILGQIDAARREWRDEGDASALARAEHWRALLNPGDQS